MKIKRAAPVGAKNILLIILTLIIICSISGCAKLKSANNALNATIDEQTNVIKDLNLEKDNLITQIAELEEKNNQLSQKKIEQPKATTQHNGTSLGKFKISAYCPCKKCCGKWAGGNTASGTTPTAGRTIAVDPKVIPLGSKVIIDGHTYIAEDTGGAIKGNRIDMYFTSHQEALNWGIKYKEISVIK